MDGFESEPLAGCAGCGSELRPAARFCIRCGAPIAGVEPHAPIAAPPRNSWRELRTALQLWVLLLAACGGLGVAARITGSQSPSFDAAGAIAVALIVLCFAAMMPRELGPALSLRIGVRGLAGALGVWIALLGFIHLYFAALAPLGMDEVSYLEPFHLAGWPLWSAFFLVAVCPAVCEEMAFRGVIYQRLERVGSPTEALVLQAAMFSVLHLLPAIFISHFVIGLALGWLRRRTRSIVPGILAHGLYNASLLLIEMWG